MCAHDAHYPRQGLGQQSCNPLVGVSECLARGRPRKKKAIRRLCAPAQHFFFSLPFSINLLRPARAHLLLTHHSHPPPSPDLSRRPPPPVSHPHHVFRGVPDRPPRARPARCGERRPRPPRRPGRHLHGSRRGLARPNIRGRCQRGGLGRRRGRPRRRGCRRGGPALAARPPLGARGAGGDAVLGSGRPGGGGRLREAGGGVGGGGQGRVWAKTRERTAGEERGRPVWGHGPRARRAGLDFQQQKQKLTLFLLSPSPSRTWASSSSTAPAPPASWTPAATLAGRPRRTWRSPAWRRRPAQAGRAASLPLTWALPCKPPPPPPCWPRPPLSGPEF